MAAAAGIDLHGRNAQGGHAVGVVGILDVALDHGDAIIIFERQDGLFHQGGLARAGRAHEVDDIDPFIIE